jgi:hypothetical protein
MQLGSTPDELSWISKFGEVRRLQWRHASYCVASAGLEDCPPSQSVINGITFTTARPLDTVCSYIGAAACRKLGISLDLRMHFELKSFQANFGMDLTGGAIGGW